MFTTELIAQLRAETPGCDDILHLDNAGASLMPNAIHDAVLGHLALERRIGGYAAERNAQASLQRLYDGLAAMLRVEPEEIAFVENATRAWDMAFYSLPLRAGDRIITHASEYVSNYLAFLQLARRRGVEIDLAASDGHGQIDVDDLNRRITARTRLIAITHVPTHGATINPVADVGSLAREHGITFMLDACQSVGQLDIDVVAIGCQILTGTGRKFLRGPRGTGFLYVSQGLVEQLDPPFVDVRSATWIGDSEFTYVNGAKRFENWESYVAGRIGLAAAVDYALRLGLDAIEDRTLTLAEQLRRSLADLPGITVCDRGIRKSGIVTFTKAGITASALAANLESKGINISVATPQYSRLEFAQRGLTELARASVHYYNTDSEIERFCCAVANH